jgi:general secretion pathway protein G
MAIETCENCKRIIGELEQAYTWQNHILCKECYDRLSNPAVAQPTPVDIHAPVVQPQSPILPPPQRSLVKSTLIVMATVIAVIVVIYIILSIPSILSSYEAKKQAPVIVNLKILHSAVNQFKMDTGRFPTDEEGLGALIVQPTDVTGWEPGGYLETTKIPKDSWGHDFVYQLYPESGKPFVIISYGADGEEGGEGINADLRSTDPY